MLKTMLNYENPPTVQTPYKKIHYSNIINAIIFEVLNVIISKQVTDDCQNAIYMYLSKMLDSEEPNYRFLALDGLMKMKHTPSFGIMIKSFFEKLSSLIATEKNSSLRLQIVNVIYSVGDLSNAKQIVENMIEFLKQAEMNIRQELTLKICTIASKNISDTKWFIEAMIQVLTYGREYTSEEVWFKVIQIVGKHKQVQSFATKLLFTHMQTPNCTENILKLGVYLIGEYGHILKQDSQFNAQSQYSLVIGLFPFYTTSTKLIIMTTLAKMAKLLPEIKQQIIGFFSSSMLCQNIDNEIQQRACEYKELLQKDDQILSLGNKFKMIIYNSFG